MTVFPQGGAERRYGSRFVCEVKTLQTQQDLYL